MKNIKQPYRECKDSNGIIWNIVFNDMLGEWIAYNTKDTGMYLDPLPTLAMARKAVQSC